MAKSPNASHPNDVFSELDDEGIGPVGIFEANYEEMARFRPDLLKVASFGAGDFQSHLLPSEILAMKEQLTEFEAELKRILDEVWDVYEAKGELYDRATAVWHHFPFGLTSFASQIFLKATRFVSLLQRGEETPLTEIDGTLRDIVVYSWYAWAYARLRAKASVRGGE